MGGRTPGLLEKKARSDWSNDENSAKHKRSIPPAPPHLFAQAPTCRRSVYSDAKVLERAGSRWCCGSGGRGSGDGGGDGGGLVLTLLVLLLSWCETVVNQRQYLSVM